MIDIFENAYFGKPYKTRDGRRALFIAARTFDGDLFTFRGTLIEIEVEGDGRGLRYNPTGKIYSINMCKEDNVDSPLDIVSEWHEPIDEEELDKNASNYSLEYHNQQSNLKIELADGILLNDSIVKAYKAGYLKAMEN